jgi:hypothetical protein
MWWLSEKSPVLTSLWEFFLKRFPLKNGWFSEVSPQGLLPFDGFKEGFEVSFAKRFGAPALNNFKEKGGPILNGFGEQLQEVTVFIPVHQDVQGLEDGNILVNRPHPFGEIIVIGFGDVEKFNASTS